MPLGLAVFLCTKVFISTPSKKIDSLPCPRE
nr:MAG TPA: hypothetical protein [Caudoviricetes sp.]